MYLSILRLKCKRKGIRDGIDNIPIVQRKASTTSEFKPPRVNIDDSEKDDVGRKKMLGIDLYTFHLDLFFKARSLG